MSFRTFLIIAFTLCSMFSAHAESEVPPLNYVIGTQAIGGRYQFTGEAPLLESAKLIAELGSPIMKFAISPQSSFGKVKCNVIAKEAGPHSLAEVAAKEPAHRAVLDMPFTHFLIWAYTFSTHGSAGTFKPAERDAEYREMYEFARHLLSTYTGSGKSFYIGHWEGDWHMRPQFDPKQPFPEHYEDNFTAWLTVRQQAIDDAKRDTPHARVWLWNYTEVNLVEPFLKGGQCITNDILPKVDVDFVSYSCYDSLQRVICDDLFAALNHIESKLKPKPGIAGKRVFIGEYGFPARRYSPAVQNSKSLEAMRAGLEWGCPFVLYWELYDNEGTPEKPGGFWLINEQNEKQPVWNTHRTFFAKGREWAAQFTGKQGRQPTDAEYRAEAVKWLNAISAGVK